MTSALLVMAKAPVPGLSKTRLCPPCSFEEAAILAEAALGDTLETVAATGVGRTVVVLDGEPGPWLPRGPKVMPQRGDGLAERLAAAFEDADGPALLIGMDTPQVTSGLLERSMAQLRHPAVDAVLGEAEDGGYWAIGMRDPDPAVFFGVPMSRPHTAVAQRQRLRRLGQRVAELPRLRDVDLIEDAYAVASAVPGSRFAHALREVLSTRRAVAAG